MKEEDSIWEEILTSETLWVAVAAIVILAGAFYLATSGGD